MREHIVALDLELNQPSGKIIQVGAVIGHLPTAKVVAEFSVFVNPQELLCPRIGKLTGIRAADVEIAGDLQTAGQALAAWLAPYAESRQLNPLTWGGGDSDTLRAALSRDNECWLFGRRWIDVKTIYAAWRLNRGEEPVGGLARSMTKLGLTFQGRKHNATDDARNTFRMFVALCRQFNQPSFGP